MRPTSPLRFTALFWCRVASDLGLDDACDPRTPFPLLTILYVIHAKIKAVIFVHDVVRTVANIVSQSSKRTDLRSFEVPIPTRIRHTR